MVEMYEELIERLWRFVEEAPNLKVIGIDRQDYNLLLAHNQTDSIARFAGIPLVVIDTPKANDEWLVEKA